MIISLYTNFWSMYLDKPNTKTCFKNVIFPEKSLRENRSIPTSKTIESPFKGIVHSKITFRVISNLHELLSS